MSYDSESSSPARASASGRRTSRWLSALAVVVVVSAAVIIATEVLSTRLPDGPTRALRAVAIGGLALGIAGLLHALTSLFSTGERLHDSLQELHSELAEIRHELANTHDRHDAASGSSGSQTTAAAPDAIDVRPITPPPDAPPWSELMMLLRDVRENTLLSEPERQRKAARIEQQELQETDATLKTLARAGDFQQAEQRLAELERKYPRATTVGEMRSWLEQQRAERQESDAMTASRRVDELISISAWDRARSVVEELARRHPNAGVIAQLRARIDREFAIYEDAQRTRMYAEIQRYVSRRRWREALAAAQTFIERFPDHSEAETLSLQLSTLANNAEIAERAELEAEITELAKRGQYAEAEELARRVIERFPDSPTAEILRSQLDRLHELATNPNAPPPRVRPSGASSSIRPP